MEEIDAKSIEDAKKKAKKKGFPLIKAKDDHFNRKLLEQCRNIILLSPEAGNRKDSLRQIDSGLNHVLAKIASKNKNSIAIDLKELSSLEKHEKASRISKIIQNIKICRKAKTRLIALNTSDKKAFHFLISLGASTLQARQATTKSF